jgi:hypothetical protein
MLWGGAAIASDIAANRRKGPTHWLSASRAATISLAAIKQMHPTIAGAPRRKSRRCPGHRTCVPSQLTRASYRVHVDQQPGVPGSFWNGPTAREVTQPDRDHPARGITFTVN